MNMVEKVARATYSKFMEGVEGLEPSWDELPEYHQWRLKEATKAAIEAMREPTEEMMKAGVNQDSTIDSEAHAPCVRHWEAMIDAALKE